MAEDKKRRKRRRKGEFKYQDFRVILNFPERLAQHVREWLHVTKADWDFCIDKIRQGNPYKEWRKSKGRGRGFRYFAAPCEELKLVQRAILYRMLMPIPVHFARHGNQPGSSILSNAQRHLGFAKSVFSVDIINAFPTVFRSRVKANLRKPFLFGLRQFSGVEFSESDTDAMLEALCDITCLHDRLPQGPPTSPRILDIVCMKMDMDIYKLLSENATPFQSYRYTAWCDDLTISSDGEIPEELRQKIIEVVRASGFIPHVRPDKTKYYSPETGEVPCVTGLVLTDRITVAPNKVNQLRARLHHFLSLKSWNDEAVGRINGTLGFIRQIYPEKLPSKLREYVPALEKRLSELKSPPVPESAKQPSGARKKKMPSAKKAKKPASKPKKGNESSENGNAREVLSIEAAAPTNITTE